MTRHGGIPAIIPDIKVSDVQGLEGVLSMFGQFMDRFKERAIQITLQAGLEIEQRAKQKAPKKFGFLRASIGHYDPSQISRSIISGGKGSSRKGRTARKSEIGEGIFQSFVIPHWVFDREKCRIEVGSGLYYARKQENWSGPHTEGQSPFLAPSFAEVKPLYMGAISDEYKRVAKAVRQAKGKS